MFDQFQQLVSSDFFFYYGNLALEDECRSDLIQLLYQRQRSLFFFRNYGADVKKYENYPRGLTEQVGIAYNITESVAERNLYVTDGAGNTQDRRIVTSQGSIYFDSDNKGNFDISVYYFILANLAKLSKINLPTGRTENVG